jgi:anti-sigma regulatory factor (Ser/Thr protein kinase)
MSSAVTYPEGAGVTERHGSSPRPRGASAVPRRAVDRYPSDDAQVGRARALIRTSLASWDLAGEIPSLELAVSELVTNAMVHGSGDIEVCVSATDGVVRLDVVDEGSGGSPHVAGPGEPGGHGGWGLLVVERLADAWGAETGTAGTHVWMERTVTG